MHLAPRHSLLISSLLLVSTAIAGHAATFQFDKGDRVAIVGNGLADRMQHDGWLETFLQLQHPEQELSFRNLGFIGDEVTIRMRSSGFGSPEEWLDRTEATVVFAMFGYNEAQQGEANLEKFHADLSAYVESVTTGDPGRRIVLFTPIAFEETGDRLLPSADEVNSRLAKFANVVSKVGKEKNVPVIDIFQPTLALFDRIDKRLTINGIHLTDEGNRLLGQIVSEMLPPDGSTTGAAKATSWPEDRVVAVNEVVREKNFYWFNRYRATDGYSTYGARKEAGGSDWTPRNEPVMKRELEILDQLTANRDPRIWAVAQGSEFKVDDSNLPEHIVVETNKPGPLDDGSYPFLGGEEAIEKMTLAEGMEIELFASEEMFPELINPVQMSVDTRGRLWVAVWPSYPHWKPGDEMDDKLLILEDTDGDGKADECKTFAGGLHNPTGFEFYNGGIYVAGVPDVWFFQDLDGDDKVDSQQRILGGIDSADTHHSINSFTIGPGGGLYCQEGLFHRTQVETPFGPPVRLRDGGVLRYDPMSQATDIYSAYIFPNPHGHVFDRWGMNIVHDGTGASAIFGPSFSGRTVFPNSHRGAPKVYNQRTRPCSGTAIVSSSHFPESMRGNFLVCNVIGFQGVLQYELKEEGSGLKGEEVEPLVFSSDPNFRPSFVEIGGDGAVYIADWQNPLIGHLQHNLRDANRDRRHGRIYRVKAAGRPLREPLDLTLLSVGELVKLLEQPDDDIRYRTKQELSGRSSTEVLQAVATWKAGLDPAATNFEHHLLEALWMHQHFHDYNSDLLVQLLRSEDHRVRAAAALVLRAWREVVPGAMNWVKQLVADDHPRVRLMGVLIANDVDSAAAAELVLEAARYPTDHFLNYAIVEATKTLAPRWRETVAAGKPFAESNPNAIDFMLKAVPPNELMKLRKNEAVLRGVLAQQNVAADTRFEALESLATIRNQTPVDLLIQSADELSRGNNRALTELLQLGGRFTRDDLEPKREIFEQQANTTQNDAIRGAALLGLARTGSSPQNIWQQAAELPNGAKSLFEWIPRLPEEEIRNAFFPFLKMVLPANGTGSEADDESTILSAISAIGSLSGMNADRIDALLPVAAGDVPRTADAALAALNRFQEASWNANQAAKMISAVVARAEQASIDQRSRAPLKQSLGLAEQLISKVPESRRAQLTLQLDSLEVQTLAINTVPHRMSYDVEKAYVQAGRPVQLTMTNPDNMPHNLVLVKPGSMEAVGLLVEASGTDQELIARSYVPEASEVLAASKLLQPGDRHSFSFVAPSEPGVYPYICTYPGHWRRMFGALYVVEDFKAYEADPAGYLAANQLQIKDDLLQYNRPSHPWTLEELADVPSQVNDSLSLEEGKKLFTVSNCVACHKYNGEGNDFAPNLAELDLKRGPDQILRDILEPSWRINEKYQTHSFLLLSGKIVTGLIVGEDEESIRVMVDPLASCDPEIIKRDDIDERFVSQTSTMPQGLLDRLTEEEIAKLIGYVNARLKP